MSPLQSRCRLLAGLGVLLASCFLAVRPADARPHRSIIVDIAPLQPLQGSPARSPALSVAAEASKEAPKSAAAADRSGQTAETGPERKADVEKALDSTPATAPTAESPRSQSASAEVLLNGGASAKAAESAGAGSIVLAPSARTQWISSPTPGETLAEGMSFELEVKRGAPLVGMQASASDPTAGAKDLQLTGPSASSLRVAGEREAAPLTAASASPRDPANEAVAEMAGPALSTPYPVVLSSEARRSKRSPALSALAKDVQLISTVVPAMQPPKPASGEGAGPSGDRKDWEPNGPSFQLSTAWLIQPSGEPWAAPATEPDIKASKPSAESEDRGAGKTEPERKSQFWRRLVQMQATGGAEEAAGQSKLLKALKQLVGGTPETPAERAYAALLQQGVRGPTRLRIGDLATLSLPFGYVFLDAEKARDLLDGEEGAPDEGNFGVILPSTRTPTWMAYVDLIEQGHIKDDDAKALAPSTLLAGLANAAAAQNVERGRNGLAPLTVGDWIAAPKYLPSRHSLSSCLSAVDAAALDPQARLVNCTSLLLGRHGAIEILVAGALPNLVSFEKEAAALSEKIAYDPDAAYERYVPGADDDAGYGLVSLAGGIVGLKSIAAPVSAAGAGNPQDLLLYRFLGYWEAILTALIAAALGTYWFRRNRPRGAQETGASRPTAHMPFWKAALWAARGGLRRLFDKAPARSRLVAASAKPAETARPSPPAQPKARSSAWAQKLVAKLSVLKSRLARKSEKSAAPQADIDTEAKTAPAERTNSILTSARQAKRGVAAMPPSAPADGAPQASAFTTESVAANAGDLNRLASLMRKKDKALARAGSAGGGAGGPPSPSVKAEQIPVEGAKRGSVDLFDLVEPGDAEAVSLAVSKREALQKAQG